MIARCSSRLIIASGEVEIDGDIDNDGQADITLSGDRNNNGVTDAGDTGILRIATGSTVGIDGLVLRRGYALGAEGTDGTYGYYTRHGSAGESVGGGIENFGILTLSNSMVVECGAQGGNGGDGITYQGTSGGKGGGGGNAAGGIFNAGTLIIQSTLFESNQAIGGIGGLGGIGHEKGGFLLGGNGGRGGNGGAAAAAILNIATGSLILYGVTTLYGTAVGGDGGDGGAGGSVTGTGMGRGFHGGNGGNGGAVGGGIVNIGSLAGDIAADSGVAVFGLGGDGGQGGIGNPPGLEGALGLPGTADPVIVDTGSATLVLTQLGTNAADDFAGTSGVDRYDGRGGNDTILGIGGNDVLDGGAGDDSMAGGLGNDAYTVDSALDSVAEELNAGYDTINTTLLVYHLGANVERVNFIGAGNVIGFGNNLNNRFQSGAGNDRFVADAGGADIYSGGAGIDTMDFRTSVTGVVLNFTTLIHGGAAAGDRFASIEKFLGSNIAGDTMIAGGFGRFIFAGYGGDDALTGGVLNDQLIGGEGNDQLSGGDERDALRGDGGNDVITGGAAGDAFDYGAFGFGQDIITDFEDGIDRFRMSGAVADSLDDFIILGNGTTTIALKLVADINQTIELHGAAAITVTAADFEFY